MAGNQQPPLLQNYRKCFNYVGRIQYTALPEPR